LSAADLKLIGVHGGTFDPVHLGHTALAEAAAKELQLDEVLWMPSGTPGHRGAPVASAAHRLAMLELAVAGQPRWRIDAAELQANEETYTINTLTRLRRTFGDKQPLVVLLGTDSFLTLPSWKRWEELFDLAHFAIANRPGFLPGIGTTPAELAAQMARRADRRDRLGASPAGKIASFDMPQLDISASAIRSAIAAGTAPRDLLAPAVLAYIESNQLYRKEPSSS
jgi:nicotinate-nucleotide adenylyltransferase